MKRLIPVIMLMLGIVAKAQSAQTRVMVISDPHILTAANIEKRIANNKSTANMGGKMDTISPAIFNEAVKTIIQAKPEALLVCGDMTFNGEASGHAQAAAAFATIEAKGIPVLVIPGNHDILNPLSEDDAKANVTAEQFKTLYGAFGLGDDSDLENISRDAKSLSWAGSLKGTNLAIIGLDANIYDGTYYSDGCLRKSTITWMTEQAAALRSKGKMVVCMVHEQLVDHVNGKQTTKAPTTLLNVKHTQHPVNGADEDALTNADLQKAFADAKIQYVMTGHFHIHHVQEQIVQNSDGEDFTLTELATGGLTTYPNWMRTVVFDTEKNQLANTTSTMVQMKVGESDLQTTSEAEFTTWANDNYKQIPGIASMITSLNRNVSKYEIYDGTTQYQLKENAYSEVIYTRNFDDNNWQVLYVPIDMQYSDWSGTCEVAQLQSVDGDNLVLSLLTDEDTLVKNTPAFVRLKKDLPAGKYSITTTVKTSSKSSIKPVDSQSLTLSGVTLKGNYEGLTGDFLYKNNAFTLSAGALAFDNEANGNTDVKLLPQRWYLTEESGNKARVFSLVLDGEPVLEHVHDFSKKNLSKSADANGLYSYICATDETHLSDDKVIVKYDGVNNLELTFDNSGAYTNNLYVEELALADKVDTFYVPVAFTAKKVTYNRIASKDTVTVFLPFDVPADKVNGNVYSLAAFDGKTLKYSKQTDGIKANTPYLLYKKRGDNRTEALIGDLTDVTVHATNVLYGDTTGNAIQFGAFKKYLCESGKDFDYYAYKNGKFKKAAVDLLMSPFRAAVKLALVKGEETALKAARVDDGVLDIILNDEVAGVEINDAAVEFGGIVNVYDSLGRILRLNVDVEKALDGLKDGIYFVNSKKVVVNNK